jgi:hypothetical protein
MGEIIMNQHQLIAYLEFVEQLEIDSRSKNVIVLASPKSAGSFFHFALIETLGYHKNLFSYKAGFSHHNLYWPKVVGVKASGLDTVAHHHSFGNQDNVSLIKRGQLIPIVLIRNIFDSLISLRDHLLKAKEEETGWCFGALSPTLLKKIKLLGSKEQLDFLIDRFAHLFFDFYLSWLEASKSEVINPLFISYEELVNDKVGTIVKAARFIGEDLADARVRSCVQELETNRRKEIRFNEGRCGRGREILSEEQIQKIINIAEFYKTSDLEPLGIFQKQKSEPIPGCFD